MIKKILKLLSDHSQITLIVSILLMIIFAPYYWNAPFTNFFNFLFLSLILLSAILTMKKSSIEFKKRNSGLIKSLSARVPPFYYIASRHSPRQMGQGFASPIKLVFLLLS
jgi:hypothetical protein